ncbi:MAG: hypothetical protein H7Y18_10640 [Clostridiaceae bacterium]|nr:hypothetical protein [Clostridiaceae bacterium]
MFENIFETVIKGSNTIFLDVNESDYYLSYDTINNKAAEEITNNFFRLKQKDGIPKIIDITEDRFTHTIKITVEVDTQSESDIEPYIVPDSLNVTRNQ